MKYEKNRKIAGIDEFKIQKIAKFMIIPAVAIVLILVILISDKKDKKKEESAPASTVAIIDNPESAADESDPELYIHNFDAYGLQKDAVPEINELIAKYQRAKVTGDATLLYEVFGRTDTDGLDEMQAKLQEESLVYESYENTTVYTTAGVEEGSYLAYIASDVKFSGIDTPAPMLVWAYIVRGSDGKLHMKEPNTLTEEEQNLLDKISASEDVKLLDSEMRTRLAQAVVSDVHLAALYEMWSEDGSGADANAAAATISEPGEGESLTESSDSVESDVKIGE